MKIGVISFTDPRKSLENEDIFEIELKHSHFKVIELLNKNSIETINPHEDLKNPKDKTYGIRSTKEVFECVKKLKDADGIVLGLWKWTDPYLAIRLVKELQVPTLLFTDTDPKSSGTTLIAAVAGGLNEISTKENPIHFERMCDDWEGIVQWSKSIKGSTKKHKSELLNKLQRSSIMLWGGSYCLRMDVLQDDIPRLKNMFIGDILQEDQYILIKRSEEIYEKDQESISKFMEFLKTNGAKLVYGGKLSDETILRRQISFYLAAKQRLEELKDENIIGVSIKCQPEFSVEYGITACTLPAFLPFPYDHTGKKQIIPTVCEGDIKGLLTAAILYTLNPEIPPLFGDLKTINDDYFIISNCGASSIYYAANSNDPKTALSEITLESQCQGEAGAAVTYQGKAIKVITVARLVKINQEYKLQIGIGKTLDVDEKIMSTFVWGKQWPHVAISLNSKKDKFMELVSSNHFCMTKGNYEKELTELAKEVGIEVIRIDNLQ